MGFVDSMKDFFGKGNDDYEDYEEEYEEEEYEQESERDRFNRYRAQTRRDNVVQFNENQRRSADASKEITIAKIKKFDEAVAVADILKAGSPVVFDVSEMEDTNDAKRVVDFISGVVCGIGGCDKRVSVGIFMATPPGMSIKFEENLRTSSTKGKWSMPENN